MWNFWGSTFWFIDSSFLLCPHMVEAGKDLCGISLVRMLIQEISFMMSPPSWPTHRPEDYILISYHCCSSVTKLCPALCDSMGCNTSGFPVLYHHLEFAQTHVRWVDDMIPCHPLLSPSPPAFNLSQSGSFPMSQPFASGGQSIRASASASVLPMNIQDWLPLGLTGLISL